MTAQVTGQLMGCPWQESPYTLEAFAIVGHVTNAATSGSNFCKRHVKARADQGG